MLVYDKAPALLTKAEFIEKYNPRDVCSYDTRCEYIEKCGWGVITKEQVEILSSFLLGVKVIEVCSGLGFLASHLRDHGVTNYLAFDNFTKCYPSEGFLNYGSVDRNVHSVNVAKAEAVVMCWPNYNSNLAETVVKKMRKGQYLIYQGEGWGGCTANDKFFEQVTNENKFQEIRYLSERLNNYQVQWCGMNDYFMVYKKLTNR